MYNYDQLDILCPPGKNIRKNCTTSILKTSHKQLLVGNKHIKDKQITQSQRIETEIRTSSSLILKKLLLEHLSFLNLTKKHPTNCNSSSKIKNAIKYSVLKKKPVIKITVVPLRAAPQTSKARKRKSTVQKVQKTVSNTNSFMRDKESRVPRNHQDIYDIRETSSAELFESRKYERNTNHHELSLNRITYTNQILNSLNMNYRVGNDKLKWVACHGTQGSPRCSRKSYNVDRECTCKDPVINNVLDDMNSQKNRVTIVGRLGLDKNEQYILNCAATVDDKPIETHFKHENVRCMPCGKLENQNKNNKSTKCTQANITVCPPKDASKNTTITNKTVQCNCNYPVDVATSTSNYEFGDSRERKSPLIVISLYPTKDTMESVKNLGDLIQVNQLQELPESAYADEQNIFFNTLPDTFNVKTTYIKQNSNRSLKSRSPSPSRKTNSSPKNISSSKTIPSPKTICSPKTTPSHKTSPKTTPSHKTIPSLKTIISPKTISSPKTIAKEKVDNYLIKRKSKKSIKMDSPDRQTIRNKGNQQKVCSNRNPIIINTAYTLKMDPFKNRQETVKDIDANRTKIKKAIINKYMQKMQIPTNVKDVVTTRGTKTNDSSNVTVNIDGENERYSVLFLHDKYNTDLKVRKTLKTPTCKPLNYLENDEESVTDFLMHSKDPKPENQITAQKKYDNSFNNCGAISKSPSALKIRDSLEIKHWREDGSKTQSAKKHIKKNKKNQEDEFHTAVKHYRGDKCCVPSPAERDQEIRKLLGIVMHRPGKSNDAQDFLREKIGQDLQRHLQADKCMKIKASETYQCNYCFNEIRDDKKLLRNPKLATVSTQYDRSAVYSFQHEVPNCNIQLFSQLEQYTKQKPVILSQNQYDKLKKTIQSKVSNKISQERRKRYNSRRCSVISIGEIRKTRKQQTSNVKINRTVQAKQIMHQQIGTDNYPEHVTPKIDTMRQQNSTNINSEYEDNLKATPSSPRQAVNANPSNTSQVVNASSSNARQALYENPSVARQTVSSMEIRYASMAHLKHVTISSTNLKTNVTGSLLCSLKVKDCPSIHTIFKGHKKSVTPNLGTSVYSLYSDQQFNHSKINCAINNEKPKKPFLRRLMSCLVMRAGKESEVILPSPNCEHSSFISSFDSYHISTSLGPKYITSSLYDTSASFYTNHTILPVAKMKRGIFSSVRGFFTNFKTK